MHGCAHVDCYLVICFLYRLIQHGIVSGVAVGIDICIEEKRERENLESKDQKLWLDLNVNNVYRRSIIVLPYCT